MVVIIAPEHKLDNEIVILHELFREGLQYFHLRKPHHDFQFYCDYLNQIDIKYHDRIVVHEFHELLENYNLKGLHFREAKRRVTSIETFENLRRANNITISSSFHSPEELADCKFKYDYHLLSPVFSSISKVGYKGQGFDVNHIDKTIIGMGGVTTKNLLEFDKLGYKGIGVLGGIWQSPSPVEDFKIIQKHYKN
ncbi:thiamine phosphate synthase [Aestuariibaculum suncheonense]|uniref:Thiamine phosphate synthase n=1 Tax=Aestuariibaculum suncheonense TaxID=1028745 RepID=A0A8J6QMC7_9FLAO|nr:thiamine phosphate synthase [Aestuariibaculum suncheonense]MBD0836736.1 thiamine phosphate synthase [Aestuariibaculum suncheonense]